MADVRPLETTDDPPIARQIERELPASLVRINRQVVNLRRTFVIRDREDRLAAGLTCSTAYSWLHVETLWVAGDLRLGGLGRKLMNAPKPLALRKAPRRLAGHLRWRHPVLLPSYAVFGEIANGDDRVPSGHHRWFLLHTL